MDKINLDTLIEAAKFVEQQEVQQESHEYEPSYAREYVAPLEEDKKDVVLQAKHTSPVEKKFWEKDVHVEETSLQRDWDKEQDKIRENREGKEEDFQDLRRRPNAGTREVHNKLEKNRRAHLKECFELVKKQLPPSPDDKKASNLNILHTAIKYIQALRRKEREFEHEMERLAREKIALQQKYANLKKELSAQWDHIDFNTFLPEASTNYEEPIVGPDGTEVNNIHTRGLYNNSSNPPSVSSIASDRKNSPRGQTSPKNIPSRDDNSQMISVPGRLESPKSTSTNLPSGKTPTSHHIQLPVSTALLPTSNPAHISATIVSPTIQLVTSSNIRMLPGGVTLMHKPCSSGEPETVGLLHANGIRSKSHPISLAIPNGALQRGLKNGIYKQSSQTISGTNSLIPGHLTSTITHVVAPIAGSHGTFVTPVPVTVVSQGSPVAHILSASPGKVVTSLSLVPRLKPQTIMSQYLVKPGAAMVVVSQPSSVSHPNPHV